MQITETKNEGLKKAYKVVVDADRINEEIERQLKTAGETVKIPGFRPGYIPMKILKQRYGQSVQADVLKRVINESSQEVLGKHKLRPALTPKVNITDYKEGGSLAFDMEMEVLPPVPEVDFAAITLETLSFEAEEKDIDEALERLAERNRKLDPKDASAKAAQGDVVRVDFEGTQDGKPVEGSAVKGFHLELGSNQMVPGFEEAFTGSKAGDDLTFSVTFPKDYLQQSLAGQEVQFKAKVHQVYSIQTPAVDDAFAKASGFADLRALREAMRNQIIKEATAAARNRLKKQLFDILEERYAFAVPEGMLALEFKSIWEQYEQAQKSAGQAPTDAERQKYEAEYRQIAERRVRLGILLAEIANRERLQVTRDELTRAVAGQAHLYPGQEKKVVEFYREHPERLEDLRGPILEEKAVDFILGKAKVTQRQAMIEEVLGADEEDEGSGSAERKAARKAAKPADKKTASPSGKREGKKGAKPAA